MTHHELSTNTKNAPKFQYSFHVLFYLVLIEKIIKSFHIVTPNSLKPSRCTPTHQELSKDSKSMWLRNLNVTNKTNKTNNLASQIDMGGCGWEISMWRTTQNKTNYLASQIDMGGCRQNASKLSRNNRVVNSWWKLSRKNCLRREEAYPLKTSTFIHSFYFCLKLLVQYLVQYAHR